MSVLSTRLKEARAAAGLTQDQLAKKAKNGLTANDISKAERALLVPTDAQLKAIAKATGVTQKSLLDAKAGAAKPSSAAKKPASSAAKTSSAAKKPAASSAKTSSAAKKPAASSAKTSSAAKNTETALKLTAAEKKLVEAYRKASAENKKLALQLLQGKAVEDSHFNIGSLFSGGLGSTVSDFFENLVRGINTDEPEQS